jgi:sugar O-acyltransferase (sialic acid O-acetyltransferase NeuD family)
VVYVAGTGSYAADVAEVVVDAGLSVVGLIELRDTARVGTVVHGLPVVGLAAPAGGAVVIGTGGDRRALAALLTEHGWARQTVVHPTAHVPASVKLGAGAFVGPCAVLGAAVVVGTDVSVARGVLVGHHTTLGPGATLNPGANVAGNVAIGAGAALGVGCVVRDHVSVGARAVVAAGAVVVADVPEDVQVRGVPARSAT